MPSVSTFAVPAYFVFRDDPVDGTKACCTRCYPNLLGQKWIGARSIQNHCKTKIHRKAEERFEAACLQQTIDPCVDEPPPGFWSNADHDLGESGEALDAREEDLFYGGEETLPPNIRLTEEEEEEDILADMMANAAIDDDTLYDVLHGDVAEGEKDSNWRPYGSQTMCVFNAIDRIPHLPISNSLMKLFLWAMKECGAKNVPSFYALRKLQKTLRETQGVPTIECMSIQNNVFFMNNPRSIIAQDWANPNIRPHLHFYPEIPRDGIIIETESGSSKVLADAYLVSIVDGVYCVNDAEPIFISTDDLEANYLDLEHENTLPMVWSNESITAGHPSKMPNHHHAMAKGEPVYTSFVDYFGDDVSGNRSKSWNKHNNSYITHRNLPRKFFLQQKAHTHFISTSQHASITEQYHDFKKVIETTHADPIRVVDANGYGTRIIIHTHVGPADNPAQSDVASSHIGSRGNHPCRKCNVGGTQEHKETNDGFHAMFLSGIPRTADGIRTKLEGQVHLACRGVMKPITARQTDTGVKDSYTQYWIDDLVNRFRETRHKSPEKSADEVAFLTDPFLSTKGFDPAKDTPVEILHTVLLGIVKYIWYYSHSKWSDANKATYALRLQATDTHGLSNNAIRAEYIIAYANSLIGRQLKTIVQTNIFHVHDLVDEAHYTVWKAVTELAALLWCVEIDNMEQYCQDIEIAADNVLDSFAVVDASKIISKIKLHLLAQIPDDTRALGPMVGVATETFESFNSVFRIGSIFSNHLAPSRNIAHRLADQESTKHQLSGGLSPMPGGTWCAAGAGVLQLFHSHPILQSLLGSDHKNLASGV
ncbi:hypothetical protein BT96DRAFT_993099 [Gymnopus androsaceus JB14]|uniref:Uncharacterized protein n=1 Tax=Gymnopus androsaceus JB14 TaxID=1447944 RepID=A0A6A4HRP2_9AGAR|nr:hypothetical protein BT96DRAFT_993099 [Gymnopus androsaceus JB14]